MTDDLKTLKDKIQDIRIAMLVTADGKLLRGRPMATQDMGTDGYLWFFTYRSSDKTDEIAQDHQVALLYADTGSQKYVSVSGVANLIMDQAKMDELWNADMEIWFDKGRNDPQLALLRVKPLRAEYWEQPGGKIGSLVSMAKAFFTGSTDDTGVNERLSNLR